MKNNRDDNEAALLQFWHALGCHWVPMDRFKGFDGLLVALNGTHIVEVKNPARKWTLTQAEQKRKAAVEAAGGKYNIVATDADARKLIGL